MKGGKPILYGSKGSPPVRTVLLVANAIGLELEFKEIDVVKDEHKTPEFTKKNPQQAVPVFEEEKDMIVCDSHAIVAYIIGKYGKTAEHKALYPTNLYERSMVDQILHFDSGILYVRLRAVVEEIFVDQRVEISKRRLDSVNNAYEIMERFLEINPYLIGDNLTIADLACCPTVTSLSGLVKIDSQKYPKLMAWLRRMSQLPYHDIANGENAKIFYDFVQNKLEEVKNAAA